MKDENKSKEQLINELTKMRHRIAELEKQESEYKQTAEVLNRKSFYLDNINDTLIVLNAEREIIEVNREFSNLWGYSSEEILGKPVFNIISEEEIPKHLSEMKKAVSTKKSCYFETVALAKSGEKVPLSIRGSAIFDKNGKPEGYIGIFRDITERRQAEEALKESEQKIRALFEGLPHALYECNVDGIITMTNPAYSKITGYTNNEIIGMYIWDMMAPGNSKDSLPAYLKQLVKEQPTPSPYVTRNLTKDKRLIDVQVDWTYKNNQQGQVEGFFCILSDITEQKKIERELLKTDENLRIKSKELEEGNTALKVLLKQRENDKRVLEEDILSNIKHLVFPYIEKLKKKKDGDEGLPYLNILESNLTEIISPFASKLSSHYLGLTPKEILIANLIKDGKQDKDIMEMLNIALDTVKTHRQNIRKKLDIYGKKINLRTYLLSAIK
jgi:PAS domain S-box-containing protein